MSGIHRVAPHDQSTTDGGDRDAASTATTAHSLTSDRDVQQIQQKLALARIANELAGLDLAWERSRRAFLIVTRRNPAGEIPKRSPAIVVLIITGGFLLAVILGTLLLTPFLPLLLLPFVALAIYLIVASIVQYIRACAYERALGNYVTRRDLIESSPISTTESECTNSQPETDVAELEEQIVEEKYQAALANLDREWEIERENHYILTRRRRFIPDRQDAYSTAVAGIVVGAGMIWIGTPAFLLPSGVVFALLGIGGGLYFYLCAQKYELALSDYEARRQALCREQFAGEAQEATVSA